MTPGSRPAGTAEGKNYCCGSFGFDRCQKTTRTLPSANQKTHVFLGTYRAAGGTPRAAPSNAQRQKKSREAEEVQERKKSTGSERPTSHCPEKKSTGSERPTAHCPEKSTAAPRQAAVLRGKDRVRTCSTHPHSSVVASHTTPVQVAQTLGYPFLGPRVPTCTALTALLPPALSGRN
jgi:hypothetical protein